MKIKVTLRGQGGELDSRIGDAGRGSDTIDHDQMITTAVMNLVMNLVTNSYLAVGDTITIEEID